MAITGSKEIYVAPRLVVYGDLERLTMAKGGTLSEGSNPPSRS